MGNDQKTFIWIKVKLGIPRENMTSRQRAIDLLEMYASEEMQRDYQKNVPHVPVPVELVCMWFDDFWHVGEEPPVAEYAEQWNDSIEKFCQAFTTEELNALKDFHQFFNNRADGLPDDDLEKLLGCPAWQEVMCKARETLEAFKKTTW